MFNNSNIGYMEGFTGTTSVPPSNEKKLPTTSTNVTTSTTSTASTAPIITGREGFNTTDRELTMLRGKRSNEVPVLSNARSQSEDVDPTDNSIFKNTLSIF